MAFLLIRFNKGVITRSNGGGKWRVTKAVAHSPNGDESSFFLPLFRVGLARAWRGWGPRGCRTATASGFVAAGLRPTVLRDYGSSSPADAAGADSSSAVQCVPQCSSGSGGTLTESRPLCRRCLVPLSDQGLAVGPAFVARGASCATFLAGCSARCL
jgi:hypothetical protein